MTDASLRVVHVFPSKESYQQNIASVGADDLVLVALPDYATPEAIKTLKELVDTINANYMPKSGGTFTGPIEVQGAIKGQSIQATTA